MSLSQLPPPKFNPIWPTMGMVCRFSMCRRYRFTLWRQWDLEPKDLFNSGTGAPFSDQYLQVIGLNPSTADETANDPTIRRCIDFAKRWGFSGLCMTNLFAWRDTDPAGMKAAFDPVGSENDHHLLTVAKNAGMVLAAWGAHGKFKARASAVEALLEPHVDLHALRMCKEGEPGHPLYVAAETVPFVFQPKK